MSLRLLSCTCLLTFSLNGQDMKNIDNSDEKNVDDLGQPLANKRAKSLDHIDYSVRI